jgi:hypothetical protein
MFKALFTFMVIASLTALLGGCADKCPKSVTDDITSLTTITQQVNAMPPLSASSTKAEIAARVDVFDKFVIQCKKLVNDNKAHAGCTINGGRWDMETTKKDCDDEETRVLQLRKILAQTP